MANRTVSHYAAQNKKEVIFLFIVSSGRGGMLPEIPASRRKNTKEGKWSKAIFRSFIATTVLVMAWLAITAAVPSDVSFFVCCFCWAGFVLASYGFAVGSKWADRRRAAWITTILGFLVYFPAVIVGIIG